MSLSRRSLTHVSRSPGVSLKQAGKGGGRTFAAFRGTEGIRKIKCHSYVVSRDLLFFWSKTSTVSVLEEITLVAARTGLPRGCVGSESVLPARSPPPAHQRQNWTLVEAVARSRSQHISSGVGCLGSIRSTFAILILPVRCRRGFLRAQRGLTRNRCQGLVLNTLPRACVLPSPSSLAGKQEAGPALWFPFTPLDEGAVDRLLGRALPSAFASA